MRRSWIALVVLAVVVSASALLSSADETEIEKADQLFEAQNYKDAADVYAAYLEANPKGEKAWHASTKLIHCYGHLARWNDALGAAEKLVARTEGNAIEEARARRVLGGLYLQLPHWGTEQGGEFKRGEWGQGRYVMTHKVDRKKAVEQFEKARALYEGADDSPEHRAERLDALFELVQAVVRFGPYDSSWGYYWYAWGDEAADDDTVGEERETPWGRHAYHWDMGTPRGIPVDEAGEAIFETEPDAYAAELSPTKKMKYLLSEIVRLDETEAKDPAARAVFLRAMLARSRYGTDRLEGWANWWSGSGHPYRRAVEQQEIWELADHQALTMLATRIAVVDLPADEDVLALLRKVVAEYPRSASAVEAAYSIGLYHQSRQQYEPAMAAYAAVEKGWPDHARTAAAKGHVATIGRAEAKIGTLGVQLVGRNATIPLTYRNTGKVEILVHRFDLEKYLADVRAAIKAADERTGYAMVLQNMNYDLIHNGNVEKYRGPGLGRWEVEVPDDGTHRVANRDVTIPLAERGAYVVEAALGGEVRSKDLLLVQDLAIVKKNVQGNVLYWVVDAISGTPVEGAEIRYLTYWSQWNGSRSVFLHRESTAKTDANGANLFTDPSGGNGGQTIAIATAGDRIAFAGFQYWYAYHYGPETYEGYRTMVVTDRPVYRPGDEVRLQIWARRVQDGKYVEYGRTGPSIHYEIYDAKGNALVRETVAGDRFGGAQASLELTDEAALGMYQIQVQVDGNWSELAGNQFRVEEYKKPEYEVTVDAAGVARLGGKVPAKISARYYFGAPVTEATVTYKVYREAYENSYVEPGEWDWLYGPGYGWCWYPFEWFGWWGRWGCRPWVWYPWWGERETTERELVSEGETRIGEDGTVDVEIDTARAASDHPDTDHRFTIEAEVRDMSRRVISGSGSVLVTRREFHAYARSDRGWYRPGDQIRVNVTTIDPTGRPVEAKGKVTLARVAYRGEDAGQTLEEPIESWDAATGPDGTTRFDVRAEASGQYAIHFATTDSAGQEILGSTVVWVVGDDFDGRVYRFNDLEVITDKRTYAPGETAYLMINANRAGSTVLFADRAENGVVSKYRFLKLEAKSLVLPFKVEKGMVPNAFIEATLVSDGRVVQEVREIVVPPAEGMVDVTVETDKAEYEPGERGTITVRTKTPDGRPVATELCLAAFDRSVLYIQGEIAPDPRTWFWGRKRGHVPAYDSSLSLALSADGNVVSPHQTLYEGGLPEGWHGFFADRLAEGSLDLAEDAGGMAFGGEMANGRAGTRLRSAAMKDGAPGEANADAAKAPAPQSTAGPGGQQAGQGGGQPPALVEAQVRKNFADTALWKALLVTDEATGEATVEIEYPENLTTWRIRAYGMTETVRVGSGTAETVTTKNLLVRLQAPRFFVERDEVVLSANVHNYLETEKTVRVSLEVPAERMTPPADATVDVVVPAGGEKRVDWRVQVLSEGTATIRVKALTDEESDAMEMTFPVLVHGMEKMVAATGMIRPADAGRGELRFTIPEERRADQSRLEIKFSPTLAGAMVDALPYLIDYPYGCTEQTLSRFVPAVQVRSFLQRQGVDLEDLAKRAEALDPGQLGAPGDREARRWNHGGVFHKETLDAVIKAGLDRIVQFQHGDGGWGWWESGESSPYMTAHVVDALLDARDADLEFPEGLVERGLDYLQGNVLVDEKQWEKDGWWRMNEYAFTACVLARGKRPHQELGTALFTHRSHLAPYGKGLLSMALRLAGDTANADTALQNLNQYLETDDENQTAWYRTPESGWWWWYNNDVETAAIGLEAMVLADPTDARAARLVKWLLANRRNGTYWRSTRDTARVVSSFNEYLRATKEDRAEYTLKILLDGKELKSVQVGKGDLLSLDNSVVLQGEAVTGGEHVLTFVREGEGAVYFNAYATFFTLEEDIPAAGLEVKVTRTYSKLQRVEHVETVQGARGQEVQEKRVRFEKVPLKSGDRLESGDLILVELLIESKNDYDYLIFEDYKPAGCEPVALRSGANYGELVSNMELRDEKVAFFLGWLAQGKHLVEYRLRAEVPGTFHALPTKAWAMYAPEIKANSDELRLGIDDK